MNELRQPVSINYGTILFSLPYIAGRQQTLPPVLLLVDQFSGPDADLVYDGYINIGYAPD